MGFALIERGVNVTTGGQMAGVNTISVPDGEWWDIKAVYALFSTSAVAGDRALQVRFEATSQDQASDTEIPQLLRKLFVPVVRPASQAVEVFTYDALTASIAMATIAAIGWTQYLLPWSPLTIKGSTAFSKIYAFDENGIDTGAGADTATVAVNFDRYAYVADVVGATAAIVVNAPAQPARDPNV